MTPTVDFETKCYERDWQLVLCPGFLAEMVRRCAHPFARRRLIVNNVSDRQTVGHAAEAAVARGEVDEFVFADDEAERVLPALGLSRNDLGIGYVYSIAELVGVFRAEADYLLHFASDSYMVRSDGWIAAAIAIMGEQPEILVANPTWNAKFDNARAESSSEIGGFYLGGGFSDQCYLIRPADFRARIYHHKHPASDRFPGYGGESFEKRVDSYMQTCGLKRITHKTAYYQHANIPRAGLWRWLRQRRPFHTSRDATAP